MRAEGEAPSLIHDHPFVWLDRWWGLCEVCHLSEAAHDRPASLEEAKEINRQLDAGTYLWRGRAVRRYRERIREADDYVVDHVAVSSNGRGRRRGVLETLRRRS